MSRQTALLSEIVVHHFSISVPDLPAAIAWNGEVLGFVEEPRSKFPQSLRAAFMKRGALRIEIWQAGAGALVPAHRREPNSDLMEGGVKHIAFAVPDLQARLNDLVKSGVDIAAVRREPTAPMAYEKSPCDLSMGPAFAAFIRDPAGTLIELLDAGRIASQP